MSVLGKHNRTEHKKTELPPSKKHKRDNDDLDDGKEEKQSNAHKPIILNVGGTKYTTTIQTLICYESILKSRFSGKFSMKPNQDGAYFVDRNGKLFEYILEYLRTGHLLLPTTYNKQDIWKFYIELKYYMIQSLFNPVLLKLFDSKIITNDCIKLSIINKITKDIFKCNSIMENIRKWKLVYEFDLIQFSKDRLDDDINKDLYGETIKNLFRYVSFEHMAIRHSLLLIQAMGRIYGLFGTMKNGSQFYFSQSFAFDCGENSAYFDPERKTNIEIEFRKVRNMTAAEKKDDRKSFQEIPLLDFYPLLLTAYKPFNMKLCGFLVVKYFELFKLPEDCSYEDVTKMELWSIPQQ